MFATKEEHEIAELADALGCSYGEAERAYNKPAPKPREPGPAKVKAIPYRKVVSMAKQAGRDYIADNPDGCVEDAAYDIANCLLYDPQVLNAVYSHCTRINGRAPSRRLIKEILADYVAEGAGS